MILDRRSLLCFLAVTLAFATLAGAALALAALNTGGRVRLGPMTIFEMAVGYERAADRALAAVPPNLMAAQQASRRGLQLVPFNTGARLRLAYLASLQTGRLTPFALTQLQTSYDLVAFDFELSVWRIRFGLEHWGELTPTLRSAVKAEADALAADGRLKGKLIDALHNVQDPAGRLTAAFWLPVYTAPKIVAPNPRMN